MLLKSHIKLIKSLAQKKYREYNGLFVVEGRKSVEEFIKSEYVLHHLYTTDLIFEVPKRKITQVSEMDLKRISQLKHPHAALAVFEIPKARKTINEGLILALDNVRDPGNLGTIIRLCDWFGVQDLLCSEETVDCYNPKVVQATMGSLTRVNVHYMDLEIFLRETNLTRYGTFMKGSNIYNTKLTSSGVLINCPIMETTLS